MAIANVPEYVIQGVSGAIHTYVRGVARIVNTKFCISRDSEDGSALQPAERMPVRRGTRLGPSRPLTMAEVKEIAADVTATTSWGDWVTAVQRYQHGVCLWDVRTDAVVPMRQVGDMRRSVGACPMLTFSTTYDLNNKMVMLNAFCTAMAKGMRLLSADEACHLLMGKGNDDASAIAAQESVTLLTAMLDGSISTFAKELYGAPPREALALGKLDQAGDILAA